MSSTVGLKKHTTPALDSSSQPLTLAAPLSPTPRGAPGLPEAEKDKSTRPWLCYICLSEILCWPVGPIFTKIFNRSLELCEVPSCFKHSTIIPIPKKSKITGLNDDRAVALTSVVMKSFEKLLLAHLKDITGPSLDPPQFAYKTNQSGLLSESLVQPSPLSKNCTYPEWAKGLAKSLWTPHIQHTPSLTCYRLVDATELWAPERPDTETVSSLRQSISWTLDNNYGTHTIYTLIYLTHICSLHLNCT